MKMKEEGRDELYRGAGEKGEWVSGLRRGCNRKWDESWETRCNLKDLNKVACFVIKPIGFKQTLISVKKIIKDLFHT